MGLTKAGTKRGSKQEKRKGRPPCPTAKEPVSENSSKPTSTNATPRLAEAQDDVPCQNNPVTAIPEKHQEGVLTLESRKRSDTQLREVIAEKEAWKARYDKIKNLFDELRDQKIKEHEEISSLFRGYQQNFASEVQAELDCVRSQTQALHKQIGQLEGELLIAQQEAEAATSESNRLSSLLSINSSAVQNVQAQTQGNIRKERDQALERIVQLEAEYNRQSREWSQERDTLQTSVREEENKVRELRGELRDAMKELRSMKTQCEESKFTCDRTRQYYDEVLAQMKSQLSIQENEAAVAKEELLDQLRNFLDQSLMADVHTGRMSCAGG